MQRTSPKVPPSKTIHDQLHLLPRTSSRAIIYVFSSKRALITVILTISLCLCRILDKRSRESRKRKWTKRQVVLLIFKVKVKIGSNNRDKGALAGRCMNNRTRWRYRNRAELTVYCLSRRYLWGSKLHAGYSIRLRFYLEWGGFWGRCHA